MGGKATGFIAVVLLSVIALVGFTSCQPTQSASESINLHAMLKPLSESHQNRSDHAVLDEENLSPDQISKGPTNDEELAEYFQNVTMYTKSDKSLKEHIEEKTITPEIVSDDYTLDAIYTNRNELLCMHYYTKSGQLMQINVNKSYLYFDDDVFEQMNSRDITFDQRTFTLLEFADYPDQVNIYYLLDKNSNATSISMKNVVEEGKSLATKETMLDAAKHLVIHNSAAS